MASNSYHAKTNLNLCQLVDAISQKCGVNFDLGTAPGFRITLDSQDGRFLAVTCKSNDQGQSNSFGPLDGLGLNIHQARVPAKRLDGASLQPQGQVTATLSSGTATPTLTNAVGDNLTAEIVTDGGTPGTLTVVRASASTVTVTSSSSTDTSVVVVSNWGPTTGASTSPA